MRGALLRMLTYLPHTWSLHCWATKLKCVEIKLPFIAVLSPKFYQSVVVDVAHMFVGIICPSFFLVSTWKVSDQKYPKKTCSCFLFEKGNKTNLCYSRLSPGSALFTVINLTMGTFSLQLSLVMWFPSHHQLLMYQWSFSCKVSATVHTWNLQCLW
jgi:hypothetical protein